MSNCLEIYKCEICGNIVQVLHSGVGQLVCCNKEMSKLEPKTNEEGITEKHKPIFIENKVIVGSVIHPMTEEHHIEFIETISNDKKNVQIKFLDCTEEPSMVINNSESEIALEYCNLHGLWQGEK